jgi:hypothetical protein
MIKPSGEAQNHKRLLFVGEEEDGRDVVQVLEDYERAWADRIKEFQLQRRIMGVEVATGAFFNGRESVSLTRSGTSSRPVSGSRHVAFLSDPATGGDLPGAFHLALPAVGDFVVQVDRRADVAGNRPDLLADPRR